MALTSWNDILNKPKAVADVEELALTVEQLSASVLSISEDVGELALDVSQLSASVLTIGEKVEELEPKVIASFTKDGTTTYAEALAGMYNTNINERSVLVVDYGAQKTIHKIYRISNNLAWFSSSITSGGHAYINTLQVQTSGAAYTAADFNINSGTMSVVNESTTIAESMQIINY